jgi:uncharacterized protein
VSEIDLRDNPDKHQFELLVDGAPAGLAAYRQRGDVTVITHSEVDPRFRGQGLGNELATRTLNMIRDRGGKVTPVCPFFAAFVEQHHDWDDIIA